MSVISLKKLPGRAGPPPKPWPYPEHIEYPEGVHIPEDEFSDILPKSGFLHDFIRLAWASEASPFFNLWAGLWTLATVSRRRAFLPWGHGSFYPNLYVILLSPPGVIHKGASINHAKKCLRALVELTKATDPVEHFFQEETVLSSKGTPEALNIVLKPRGCTFSLADGTSCILNRGSLATIAVDEFTTFVNRSTYNSTLIDKLTNYYDGQDEQTEVTIVRQREVFENIFMNMLSGTTPDHLLYSLPETAFGGGFLSRVIIPFQGMAKPGMARRVPQPFIIPGYPDYAELAKRLYWCTKNFCGEPLTDAIDQARSNVKNIVIGRATSWDPEARHYHDSVFYPQAQMYVQQHMEGSKSVINRMPQMVLKVAMLLRMADYMPGTDITMENIKQAEKLVKYTLATSDHLLQTAQSSNPVERVKSDLRRKFLEISEMNRQDIVRYLRGRGITNNQLNDLLYDLSIEGLIEVWYDKKKQLRPLGYATERYVLLPESRKHYLQGEV